MMQSRTGKLSRLLVRMPWFTFFLTLALCGAGVLMLYDAAGGNWQPYALNHTIRIAMGLPLLLGCALVPPRTLYKLVPWFFAGCVGALVYVEIAGHTAMGAQRWISLGPVNLQPSEFTKIALIAMLARLFHSRPMTAVQSPVGLILLAGLILIPFSLILKQPDLGTAIILVGLAIGMAFVAGMSVWFFVVGGAGALAALPIVWSFLHNYQQQRVLTFLSPERDPLGAGYHVIQSKIAIGSAGFWGKGFLQGTQAHLQFLPEKHTDFIFTLLIEDFGLFGALIVLLMLFGLMLFGIFIALRCRHRFGQLLSIGVVMLLCFHTTVNTFMVMGMMPVVGVPLPFISYGGTSLWVGLMGVGLMMNAHIYRESHLPDRSGLRMRV